VTLPDWLSVPLLLTVLQVAIVAVIGVYTYRKEMLNAAGALTAFAMGAAIVVATNIFWLFLLFALLGLGSAATRFKFSEKEKLKVAEKNAGRRRSRNVVANGLTPTIAAVLAPFLAAKFGALPAAMAFTCAVAVAAADTLASEFGSLAKRVYLITTFKPVPPGTDGGFSVRGQVAALAGAAIVALLGLVFTSFLTPVGPLHAPVSLAALWIPVAMGFLGCQVDSLLGATLEGKGYLNKEEVNFLSITVGAALGVGLALLA
jgi:uncharacterized protein (TIGR00297 family)